MLHIDANVVCRHLLQDNDELSRRAGEILSSDTCFLSYEVAAEVVYVLVRVYGISRERTAESLKDFLPSVLVENTSTFLTALNTFSESKLDFVDCILFARNHVEGVEVATFDKKLINKMRNTKKMEEKT